VFQAPAAASDREAASRSKRFSPRSWWSKYADGLPVDRQEAILAQDSADLDGPLVAQWMGQIGFELQPLSGPADTCSRIWQVAKSARLWAYAF
jgi:transposase